MKVGIVTYHCAYSYGAVLQAYALQQVIASLGHNAFMVDYVPKTRRDTAVSEVFKARSPSGLVEFINQVRKERAFKSFKSNFRLTKRCADFSELEKAMTDFDACVCGSDQIWHPKWFDSTGDFDNAYFLGFCPNSVRRIAYAPSFGCQISESFENAIKPYLLRFNAIAMREQMAAEVVSRLIGRNVECVCDPTILLGREGFDSLIGGARAAGEGSNALVIFPLSLSSQFLGLSKFASKFKSVEIIGRPWKLRKMGKSITPDPLEWIRRISGSQFVVTNSFHGTVFSILYHRPFVTLAWNREQQNLRVKNLLSQLGLERRFLDVSDADFESRRHETIDWSVVDEKLSNIRNLSLRYLQEALK